jgi:hypothetical protein
MTTIIWKFNDTVVKKAIELGSYAEQEESVEYEIELRHDSTRAITDCELYFTPYSENYEGTENAIKDFEKLIWMGNNYEDYGVCLIQEYNVTGIIDIHNGIRIFDLERFEPKDVFAGSNMDILSGAALGESIEIDSYDEQNKLFIMKSDFSTNVEGSNYEIKIRKESYLKTQNGSSFNYPIPLIYKGGVIDRLEYAPIKIKVKVPPYAIRAGKLLFDLQIKFISQED